MSDREIRRRAETRKEGRRRRRQVVLVESNLTLALSQTAAVCPVVGLSLDSQKTKRVQNSSRGEKGRVLQSTFISVPQGDQMPETAEKKNQDSV